LASLRAKPIDRHAARMTLLDEPMRLRAKLVCLPVTLAALLDDPIRLRAKLAELRTAEGQPASA
jgi:hypothetical protein